MLSADIPQGKLRGAPLHGDGGALFAGIPFAEPPVGPLRLRPPQPPRPWSGVRDASRYRAAPLQRLTALAGSNADAAIAGASVSLAAENSEDCLYLNVWTPEVTGRRPVIVWIYGGGFDMGSAAPPMTDGAALSRQTGTVVVAANYRVGALGYLHLAELGGPRWATSSNLGLQDQAAALHWVRQNIAALGGDPTNITVAGESAGAFSIGSLLATPAAAGMFHRAILSSGSTERVFTADIGTAVAADLLTTLGLDTVDGLLDVPAELILTAQNTIVDTDIGRRNLPGGRSWGVVLDGTILPAHPNSVVASGDCSDVGLLIGANRDELRLFQFLQGDTYVPTHEQALLAEMHRAGVASPRHLLTAYRARMPHADLAELRTMFLTDAIYRLPATKLAAAHTAAGGSAHTYLFAAQPFGPQLGACHAADLPFLFDGLEQIGRATDDLLRTRDELTRAWGLFAATGAPGWPRFDPTTRPNTRQFGAAPTMITEPPIDDVAAAWQQA